LEGATHETSTIAIALVQLSQYDRDVLITVDPASRRPLFEQVAGAVRLAVVRGELAPGERLPAARDLAASLDLNVNTVLHAYRLLRDEGLLELRRGRGAVVGARAAHDHATLRDLVARTRDEAARLGVHPTTLAALLSEENPT
jgi:GntR family transcriptional regulator